MKIDQGDLTGEELKMNNTFCPSRLDRSKRTLWHKIKLSILLIWLRIYSRLPNFVSCRQPIKVKIQFDYDKVDLNKLLLAEDALRNCGVKFDTARPNYGRVWIIGWDPDGPCSITYMDKVKRAAISSCGCTLADIWR